jgi:hypothetical protein
VLALEVPDSFPPWLSGTSSRVHLYFRLSGGPVTDTSPGPSAGPDRAVCSAKGCQTDAVWDLGWNNPKIHTPERRKSWLACDEHRASLSDFLGARGFLRDVVPYVAD